MIPKITVKQMLAARMLVEDHTDISICRQCDIASTTLKKWMEDPEFQAYQETVRQEHNSFLVATTQIERKKHKITLAGIVEELHKLADLPVSTDKITVSDKIKLYTALIDLLQLKPTPGTGEAMPEPDVYVSEWARKPQ